MQLEFGSIAIISTAPFIKGLANALQEIDEAMAHIARLGLEEYNNDFICRLREGEFIDVPLVGRGEFFAMLFVEFPGGLLSCSIFVVGASAL